MINKILEELDRMMDTQEREIEIDMETEHESRVYFETAKLFAYREVEKIIKKCAQEAATSEGTDINSLTQADYNTDRQKSEIRKTAIEIFDLSLRLQEMTDGTIDWIDWREPGVPCVYAEYHGATAVLSVKIWENGFSAEQRPDYSTMLFLDNPNCMIEAGYLKEKLMGLLEERRGSDNGKDDSDHN